MTLSIPIHLTEAHMTSAFLNLLATPATARKPARAPASRPRLNPLAALKAVRLARRNVMRGERNFIGQLDDIEGALVADLANLELFAPCAAATPTQAEAQHEAIAMADAHLNNAGLPTYSELVASLRGLRTVL